MKIFKTRFYKFILDQYAECIWTPIESALIFAQGEFSEFSFSFLPSTNMDSMITKVER